ncbi:MAG: MBL fold metallo-hydrolase [Candidatus Lokiarchaeota archaeon]|nr:MBL fold metallo-hydrolase [Candidatus Lokiarchaeota archaeon]
MEEFNFICADKSMWPASANIFSIADDQGIILIDVGCGLKKFVKKLYRKLETFHIDINNLHTIVISHAHPDHMGAIKWLFNDMRDYHNLTIIINEIEKPSALNIDLLNKSFDIDLIRKYLKTNWRNRLGGFNDINDSFKMLCAMSQLPEDTNIITIKNNDLLNLGNYTFRVLTTPGHAPGHTSFYEINKKFLLSGDLIGEKGTAWYSPSSGGAVGYLKSLDKVDKLEIKRIYPSHGNEFSDGKIKTRIEEIRNKITDKDRIILKELENGQKKVLDLVKLFYRSQFSQIFPGIAIVESHLIKLEDEDKIKRKNRLIKSLKS